MPTQAPLLTVFKALGVIASSLLFLLLLARVVARGFDGVVAGDMPWLAVPGLLVGYLAADMVSGTAHWFCDTFFDEETPLIGKVLIQPFRDHHVHPQRITRYRFLEQDTSNFFLMMPFLGLALWLGAPQPGSLWGMFWCSLLLGLAVGSFFTNLFHKWAHQRDAPAVARWLQRCGPILSPERHQKHHRDYSRGFCVTSGWMIHYWTLSASIRAWSAAFASCNDEPKAASAPAWQEVNPTVG